MSDTVRRLNRSARDRVFGGVCGGLAGYLDLDPVLVRVLYVGLTILSGVFFGVILYIVGWIIIPLSDQVYGESSAPRGAGMNGRRVVGTLLIVAGAIALIATATPFSFEFGNFKLIGPILLVAAGAVLLLWKRDSDATQQTYARVINETEAGIGTEARETAGPETASGTEGAQGAPSGSAARSQRMYRLESGRKIAGVCAGLGEYFSIDPTIIRLCWVVLTLISVGVGAILYVIMWIVMPLRIDPYPPASEVPRP